ncbi:rRNA-processing protein UTP23 [Nakaseomyces bracarensis]|uniref:rRNA-processing protein UTP23 n=1 Tax=Nakaseomyces bracarensis TaxID=273131 RepID=A0ABR4NT86_9SACH
MRQKRAKSYRKQLLVYNHTFKFREPYQVLLDDQIVFDSEQSKYDLVKALKRTLQAEVKPMITQCCMQALYQTKNEHAIDLGKQFERRRCGHMPSDAVSPKECIQSVVNIKGKNKHRYVVACQDVEIRRLLRKVPGVPLLHISRSVMIMEPLSDASAKVSEKEEEAKLFKGLNDPKYAGVKDESEENQSEKSAAKKRKIGPKQPNPLSMKKKKKTDNIEKSTKNSEQNGEEQDSSKKRRRRKHKNKADEQEDDISESKQDEDDTQ